MQPLKLISVYPNGRSQQHSFLSSGDTQEQFEKNLASLPLSWSWRTRTITYTLNSQNFRTSEFDTVNWTQSIVAFGCSNTFGVGVSDHDTWCHQLSVLVGQPVINLGSAGHGWGVLFVNSMRVIEAGHRPRAVIYYWSNPERFFSLPNEHNLDQIRGYGLWNLNPKSPGSVLDDPDLPLARMWIQHPHLPSFWADTYKRCLDQMWTLAGVPVYHYSWCPEHAALSGIKYLAQFDRSPADPLLLARDLVHPGPQDHARIAQSIRQGLGDC